MTEKGAFDEEMEGTEWSDAFGFVDLSTGGYVDIMYSDDCIIVKSDTSTITTFLSRRKIICFGNKYSDATITHDFSQLIDLSADGRRWEGGMKNGRLYGYEMLYNEEGRKEYEGFMMDGVKTCNGIDYDEDIERPVYAGSYYQYQRFEKGILYDRNGSVEYAGYRMNDMQYAYIQNEKGIIGSFSETMNVPAGSWNDVESLALPHWIHTLKQLVIGCKCFGRALVFSIDGLGELERIVIRKECFVVTKNWNNIKSAPSDGTFRNAICPKLKFVHTGDYSFGDYHSFTLENLPSLYFLHMGYRCFFQCPSFSLTGWNPWSDIQCRTSLTPLCVVWLCRLCILSCCYI